MSFVKNEVVKRMPFVKISRTTGEITFEKIALFKDSSAEKNENHSAIVGILYPGKLQSEFTKPHARSFVFTDFHLVRRTL